MNVDIFDDENTSKKKQPSKPTSILHIASGKMRHFPNRKSAGAWLGEKIDVFIPQELVSFCVVDGTEFSAGKLAGLKFLDTPVGKVDVTKYPEFIPHYKAEPETE